MLNASNHDDGRKILDSDCGEFHRHCRADLIRVQPVCGVSRHGRWAKNITGLLAGIGMLALAASMLLTPRNALVILQVAQTGAARVFLIISSVLLMAAIAAFGIINYSRPLRLWHQRRIGRDLRRGLPRIP